jgi:hypothetical protein
MATKKAKRVPFEYETIWVDDLNEIDVTEIAGILARIIVDRIIVVDPQAKDIKQGLQSDKIKKEAA